MGSKPLPVIPLILALIFISSPLVHGYSSHIQPQGLQYLNPGDTVTVSVYFRGEDSDPLELYGWGYNLGYDPLELVFQSYNFGPANFNAAANDESIGRLAEESYKYRDDAIKKDILHVGWYDLSFAGFIDVPAGSSALLFSAEFSFLGGQVDGEDVWVEWFPDTISGQLTDNPSYFDTSLGFIVPTAIGIPASEIYTDSSETVLYDDNPADFATIPIPGSVWLFSSALLYLIFIRRYNRQ